VKGLITFYLSDFFKYAVVVSRFIGWIAFMPGLGEVYVPNRIKVLLALALSVAITPLIEAQFPPLPAEPLRMAIALVGEILVGFFLATVVRMIVAAFDIAGTLIGFQMGLTNVFTVGIATSQQSAILGVFLGACATIILFVTDLHFLILGTLVDSYSLWKPAALPDLNLISEDLFNLVMNVLGKSFLLGLQLSGPIILIDFPSRWSP
jgi:flagellar biosynthetic protein FliR